MTARRRPTEPDPDAPALFVVDQPAATAPRRRRPPGRHERDARRALDASPHLAGDQFAAARSALIASAWALDEAEARSNAYALAQLGRPHRELLADLGLLPIVDVGGGAEDDGFGDVGAPEVVDPA